MGIRQTLNEKPKLAAGVATAALALGAVFLLSQLSSGGGGPSESAYFTIDDGQTWFEDDAAKLPPYMHDGKEAVRAHVFECGGKRFVNHLERLTPERRKLAEAAAEATRTGQPPPRPPAAAGNTVNWGQEVKKPGAKEWISASNLAKASLILHAKCPDSQEAIPVEP